MTALRNALTIDVEDWLSATVLQVSGRVTQPSDVVVDQSRLLLDLMEEEGATATWYFLGELAERWPDLVREVVERGHEVGVHGFHHHQITALGREAWADSIVRAKAAVEDAAGTQVFGYRAVDFGIDGDTWWALEDLVRMGFRHDSSIFPFKGPRYGVKDVSLDPHWIDTPAGPIYEIPVTVGERFGVRYPAAGGGYFRLFPLAYTEHILRTAHRAHRSAVLYLHPCEITPPGPTPALPPSLTPSDCDAIRRMHRSQGRNRAKGADKLRTLLSRHRFASMREVYGLQGLDAGVSLPTAGDG